MAEELSLSEFLKIVVPLMQDRNWTLPLKNERPWHEFFYRLKGAQLGTEKPKFFEHLRFDWDGPYPKSREVSDFLHALHWNASVSAANPQFSTISLSPEVADLWKQKHAKLDEGTKEMVTHAMQIAEQQFA